MRPWALVVLSVVAGAAAAQATGPADTLTDQRLLEQAAAFFSHSKTYVHPPPSPALEEVLGIHHGAEVIAEGPCLFCRPEAEQVVHYRAEVGPACDALGGTAVEYRVEEAPGARLIRKRYCVPAVLVAARTYRTVPPPPKPVPPPVLSDADLLELAAELFSSAGSSSLGATQDGFKVVGIHRGVAVEVWGLPCSQCLPDPPVIYYKTPATGRDCARLGGRRMLYRYNTHAVASRRGRYCVPEVIVRSGAYGLGEPDNGKAAARDIY